MANAQVKRTVNVATAGTLSTLITAGEKYTIDELTLTGELNGSDLRLLRDMAGNDYMGQPTNGMLKKLDLSGANIVAGGDAYFDLDNNYITVEDDMTFYAKWDDVYLTTFDGNGGLIKRNSEDAEVLVVKTLKGKNFLR